VQHYGFYGNGLGGGLVVEVPGSAGLVLVAGVVHLDQEAAVFEAMMHVVRRLRPTRSVECQDARTVHVA